MSQAASQIAGVTYTDVWPAKLSLNAPKKPAQLMCTSAYLYNIAGIFGWLSKRTNPSIILIYFVDTNLNSILVSIVLGDLKIGL